MKKFYHKSVLKLRKHSPTILTCLGAGGVIGTTILAVRATPKALVLLEEAEFDKGEELTNFEKVVVAGPAYIPAAVTGVATIACIFGANVLNKHQQASLMSAYALLETSYKEYRDKVKDLYGEETDTHIKKEIAKERIEDLDISTDDNNILFYDDFSRTYFESTIEKVQEAIYLLNRELVVKDYAYLNEYYEFLGIESPKEGWDHGWSKAGNLTRYWQEWIDFRLEKVEMEGGLECQIIFMTIEPYLDFGEFF